MLHPGRSTGISPVARRPSPCLYPLNISLGFWKNLLFVNSTINDEKIVGIQIHYQKPFTSKLPSFIILFYVEPLFCLELQLLPRTGMRCRCRSRSRCRHRRPWVANNFDADADSDPFFRKITDADADADPFFKKIADVDDDAEAD